MLNLAKAERLSTDGEEREEVESEEPVSDRIPADDLFHVLQNERRRILLRYLLDGEDRQYGVGDLAEVVASRQCGVTRRALTSDQRRRVYVALYQCHLPTLSDAGLIDYDDDRGTVSLRPEAEQTVPHLEHCRTSLDGGRPEPEPPAETDDDTESTSVSRRFAPALLTSAGGLILLATAVGFVGATTGLLTIVGLTAATALGSELLRRSDSGN